MAENKKEIAETPLMKQYNAIKAKYPDALLLFRVGDFYETFGEDAVRASSILGIVLTRRANGSASYIELAGFPHHSLDTYLPRLVRAGLRVAICDQLEDPKLTKKIVKRGITELVTPGVAYNDKILNHKENNFLAGIHVKCSHILQSCLKLSVIFTNTALQHIAKIYTKNKFVILSDNLLLCVTQLLLSSDKFRKHEKHDHNTIQTFT